MNYLQNHIWCSDSIWGGVYDCRHLVSISSYEEDGEDWPKIIDDEAERFFDERKYNTYVKVSKELYPDDEVKKEHFYDYAPNLKPHVLKWLEDNVKDRKDPDCEKGWCIGSNSFRAANPIELTVFFHRRNDALAFVRKFSKYKKPVNYCQYFADDRKKLNLETMKYEKV